MMLQESGISQQDQAKNPQAIIDVIGFYSDTQKLDDNDHAFSKFNNVYAKQLQPDLVAEEDASKVVASQSSDLPLSSGSNAMPSIEMLDPQTDANPVSTHASMVAASETNLSAKAMPVSPNRSPNIPKKPISPAKPPRKLGSSGSMNASGILRPPVPARPAHTLSIYSTDIKRPEEASNESAGKFHSNHFVVVGF